uniref:Odorant binding protein 19 n=1 Tax=Dendroctonus ponderosae TaxID=77166 RepID=A0A0H3W5L4_DENPD|nr:odorant binding protein 19 [Dendroctonus ponderosae]
MKAMFVTLTVATVVVFASADLTEEQKQKIVANGKACVAETGADPELIKAARQGKFADDAKLKAFALCMSKKSGFQNEAGEIQSDVVKQKLGLAIGDEAAAKKLVEKCLVSKGSGEETAIETFKCYYENTPTHIAVF